MLKVTSAGFAEGLIHTGTALLTSITVTTDGANDGTVIIYDNTSGSGTVLEAIGCPGASLSKTVSFYPIEVTTGLYVVVSGTGAGGNITYSTDGQSFN